jgi:hypothetical protein
MKGHKNNLFVSTAHTINNGGHYEFRATRKEDKGAHVVVAGGRELNLRTWLIFGELRHTHIINSPHAFCPFRSYIFLLKC